MKLGRTAEHRRALFANQVCSLIEHGQIRTTLAKAKAVRPLAERMLTLGKKGSLHNRRTAIAYLRQPAAVKRLFDEIAPRSAERNGGYTRIIKLVARKSDAAPMALIEWVDRSTEEPTAEPAAAASKAAPKKEKKTKTEGEKSTPPKSNRPLGSRRVLDKAKRAAKRTKKAKAVATTKAAALTGKTRKAKAKKK